MMRRGRRGDWGGLMVGLVAAVAILEILSLIAFQEWADVLRRDNEAEMMFRAQEIVRAIRKYQRDKANQPLTELKLLMEPGSKRQYFLRRLYKDPLVKDGKWGLLYQGPQGGILDPNAQVATEAASISSVTKAPEQMTGIGGGAPGTPGEMTGLPIIGVRTLCKEKPFRVYKEQSDYAQWLFTIFDLELTQGGGPNQGQPGGTPQPGVPGFGQGKGKGKGKPIPQE